MARSSSVKEFAPAVLQELAVLLKTVREKEKSKTIREIIQGYSDLNLSAISRLETGQGTGRPGSFTLDTWRIEQLAKAYEIPQFLIEKLLAGQLSASEVINSYRDNSFDNSTLTKQIRIIAQSISFADVCRLTKGSQICIQRLADIVEGSQINPWEVDAFSTFLSNAQSTLVSLPESGEDSSDAIRCKTKMTTLAALIKEELDRRQMTLAQFADEIRYISVEQLDGLIEGKPKGRLADQLDLICDYLTNPKTQKPFKNREELELFLINPDWQPRNNNNSINNGFCGHCS